MFDTWLFAVREFLAALSKQHAKERRADEERAEWNAHFIGIPLLTFLGGVIGWKFIMPKRTPSQG